MIKELEKSVIQKIENEKMLIIGVHFGASHEFNRILPEKINTDHGIYIEGEDYILDISDKEKFEISYDEMEEEFTIHQGGVTFTID